MTGTELYTHSVWSDHYGRAEAVAKEQCGPNRLPADIDLPDTPAASFW
jgi:hypothetical protein